MSLVVHINSMASSGCVARIAKGIVLESQRQGFDNVFAYGRGAGPDYCASIRIGSGWNFYSHVFESRLLDDQGRGSRHATRELIMKLDQLAPSLVHLHNIHGSYVNYPILFDWLRTTKTKVVWTLHDCWPFTGHCSYYDYVKCSKWKTGCYECTRTHDYPKSWIADRSRENYRDKEQSFTSLAVDQLVLVTPSRWLCGEVGSSFLGRYRTIVISNGVDAARHTTRNHLSHKKVGLIAVANQWHVIKGLDDLRTLSNLLDMERFSLTLVGEIAESQKRSFATETRFTGRLRANAVSEAYESSDLFINFTHEDNFPTVNVEALSHGLPIITFGAGGSAEALDEGTGWVIGDVAEAQKVIDEFEPSEAIRERCKARARDFSVERCSKAYVGLYGKVLSGGLTL